MIHLGQKFFYQDRTVSYSREKLAKDALFTLLAKKGKLSEAPLLTFLGLTNFCTNPFPHRFARRFKTLTMKFSNAALFILPVLMVAVANSDAAVVKNWNRQAPAGYDQYDIEDYNDARRLLQTKVHIVKCSLFLQEFRAANLFHFI